MGPAATFTYWKRPWHKWIILAAALLQLLALWMNVREYMDIFRAGIFSSSGWADYAAGKSVQIALSGMLSALFFGIFLIGDLVRGQRSARRAEGLLLLFLALVWGVLGFLSPLTSPGSDRALWVLVLLFELGGGAASLWRSRDRS